LEDEDEYDDNYVFYLFYMISYLIVIKLGNDCVT